MTQTQIEPTTPSVSRLPWDQIGDDPQARLEAVIAACRREHRAAELFEALKMQTRLRLGLPMVPPPGESPTRLDRQTEARIEEGLLDACRQAGAILIGDGKIAEGWMYVRPTGDTEMARRLLADVPLTEDNSDEMIHVLLHEGVDPGRGFDAVLRFRGTCNSITLHDQHFATADKATRRIVATRLLRHFYDELSASVRRDFEARAAENNVSADAILKQKDALSLHELTAKYPWIQRGGYHLDTTHLSSAVRIATVLDDSLDVQKAWELTQYGGRLPEDLQYPGESPFDDGYDSYDRFYAALLGRRVDEAIAFFRGKAEAADVQVDGAGAIEVYVDLLQRVGRPAISLREAIRLMPDGVPVARVMPDLIELGRKCVAAGDLAAVRELETFLRDRGDWLGMAAVAELNVG